MLTVMLVKDGSGKAASLRTLLEQAGVRVVAEVEANLHLADVLAAARPDVVLIDSDAPSRDMLEQVCVMGAQSERPVVMFTDDGSRDTIRAALSAGVAAYVVGDVESSRIQPLLEVAIERHQIDVSRRAELADAQRQLADRKVVEKAKGLLMEMKGLDEATAYKQLRERAMKQQKKLSEVAQEIISLAEWLKS
ncbi:MULTISPECIES: ANTAR domain-containing response regulator [Vogesella]|uniref:ANTAR domain-containing protein n=2 Tax=Vogesella indigofera TaxID=45465 RepID=A0ABT5I1X5_VOGIN|nr:MULTISPECIES: ANTAR domain-containing protein [Vogesella]KMJ54745.1 histidine kinase [Vogesella sp. EB]MCQ4145109.1 ANTAR domain-containing protein [Vogesella sp. AC12]MDC7690153.1 ANTAR domain-containing protein [Vogesella indigofera]MDC7697840.1 ANTAR domain-containing protein [Vogesella indigofera]